MRVDETTARKVKSLVAIATAADDVEAEVLRKTENEIETIAKESKGHVPGHPKDIKKTARTTVDHLIASARDLRNDFTDLEQRPLLPPRKIPTATPNKNTIPTPSNQSSALRHPLQAPQ